MKTKILWISDLSETGYTSASRILVNCLLEKQDKYEIFFFAINHYFSYEKVWEIGRNYLPKLKQSNFFTIDNDGFQLKINNFEDSNIKKIHMEQRFGYYDLERILKMIVPNIVISINDNGALENHCKIIDYLNKKDKLSIRKICYLPIDCYNLPNGFLNKITCDEMWALTEFGKKEMELTNYKNPIKVLPHAIDSKNFKKLDKKIKHVLRLKWLPEQLIDRFIILNTNKNQIRKRLDITLEVFSRIYDKYPGKVAMILKTGLKPSINDGGLDLMDEIEKLGKAKSESIVVIDKSLEIKELNELYNLVDVNINTSIGEGWGIIPCEVALCGIPQLVPNNTSYPEIFFKDCLVDCELKLRIEREGKTLINPNGLQCICKGYRKYIEEESDVRYVPNLNYSKIDSFLISERGNDLFPNVDGMLGDGVKLKYIFKSWKALEELLLKEKPLLFQVFCENGERLENIERYSREIKYDRFKIPYQIDSFFLNEIDLLRVLIKVPLIDDFVLKIGNLIENPDRQELMGELCRNKIINNFTPELIGTKMERILDDFIKRFL